MNLLNPPTPAGNVSARQNLLSENKSLAVFGFLSLGIIVIAAVGAIVDGRIITGVNGWLKPLKFGMAFSLYAFTLIWMLSYVENRPKMVKAISIISAIFGAIGILVITLQVFRNTTSHFNYATPFDSFIYNLMGVDVVLVWLANLAAAILIVRQKFANPVLGWSMRFGLILALIGAALGFTMNINETEAQAAVFEATGESIIFGAHSIGAEDGEEPSIPFLGWNSESGDLRVPHFFGLHGLQAMPLLGILLINLKTPWLNDQKRIRLMFVGGIGYFAFVMLTYWQALRGQSIITLDTNTLTAFSLLISTIAIASIWIIFNKEVATK